MAILLCLLALAWPEDPLRGWSASPEEVAAVTRAVEQMSAGGAGEGEAIEAIVARGASALPPLLDLAVRADEKKRDAIRRVLARFGPDSVPLMYLALRHGHSSGTKEEVASDAVGIMGVAALPAVREILAQRTPGSARFATLALRKLGPSGLRELVQLGRDPDEDVRQQATRELALSGDPLAGPTLVEGLGSGDPEIRRYAVIGLGRLPLQEEPDVRRRIVNCLWDVNGAVRAAAIGAAGRWYSRELRPRLVSMMMGDPAESVRKGAADVLAAQDGDPVAVRLGRRYAGGGEPGGVLDSPMLLTESLSYMFTGVLIYVVVWATGRPGWERVKAGARRGTWATVLGLALVGLFWGGLARGVSAREEFLFLVACFPVALTVCWLAGSRPFVLAFPAFAVGSLLVGLILAPFGGIVILILAAAMGPFLLALNAVPTLVVAYALGRLVDAPTKRAVQARTAAGALGLYGGYFAGWLYLWGWQWGL